MTDPTDVKLIMTSRQGMIAPRAVGAYPEGDGWLVGFRYRQPLRPEFGRALRMPPGETPRFVHQDINLGAFAPREPTQDAVSP